MRFGKIQERIQHLYLLEKYGKKIEMIAEDLSDFLERQARLGEDVITTSYDEIEPTLFESRLLQKSLEQKKSAYDDLIATSSAVYYNIMATFGVYAKDFLQVYTLEDEQKNLVYDRNIADAFVKNGVLFIRIPLLPHRILTVAKNNKFGKNKVIAYEGKSIFRTHLAVALQQIQSELTGFDMKTLNYLFVYKARNKIEIDNDNHETKSVTDTICSFFPNTDSQKSCDFTYSSAERNDIKSGTYITVIPGKLQIAREDAVIKTWLEREAKNTQNS